mgnify:FL=1
MLVDETMSCSNSCASSHSHSKSSGSGGGSTASKRRAPLGDGLLATAGWDGLVSLHDLRAPRTSLAIAHGHAAGVSALAHVPPPAVVATGAEGRRQLAQWQRAWEQAFDSALPPAQAGSSSRNAGSGAHGSRSISNSMPYNNAANSTAKTKAPKAPLTKAEAKAKMMRGYDGGYPWWSHPGPPTTQSYAAFQSHLKQSVAPAPALSKYWVPRGCGSDDEHGDNENDSDRADEDYDERRDCSHVGGARSSRRALRRSRRAMLVFDPALVERATVIGPSAATLVPAAATQSRFRQLQQRHQQRQQQRRRGGLGPEPDSDTDADTDADSNGTSTGTASRSNGRSSAAASAARAEGCDAWSDALARDPQALPNPAFASHGGVVGGGGAHFAGLLATGGWDRMVRTWDLRFTRTPVHVLTGHQRRITALAVLPGVELLSASGDNTLRAWDLSAAPVNELFALHPRARAEAVGTLRARGAERARRYACARAVAVLRECAVAAGSPGVKARAIELKMQRRSLRREQRIKLQQQQPQQQQPRKRVNDCVDDDGGSSGSHSDCDSSRAGPGMASASATVLAIGAAAVAATEARGELTVPLVVAEAAGVDRKDPTVGARVLRARRCAAHPLSTTTAAAAAGGSGGSGGVGAGVSPALSMHSGPGVSRAVSVSTTVAESIAGVHAVPGCKGCCFGLCESAIIVIKDNSDGNCSTECCHTIAGFGDVPSPIPSHFEVPGLNSKPCHRHTASSPSSLTSAASPQATSTTLPMPTPVISDPHSNSITRLSSDKGGELPASDLFQRSRSAAAAVPQSLPASATAPARCSTQFNAPSAAAAQQGSGLSPPLSRSTLSPAISASHVSVAVATSAEAEAEALAAAIAARAAVACACESDDDYDANAHHSGHSNSVCSGGSNSSSCSGGGVGGTGSGAPGMGVDRSNYYDDPTHDGANAAEALARDTLSAQRISDTRGALALARVTLGSDKLLRPSPLRPHRKRRGAAGTGNGSLSDADGAAAGAGSSGGSLGPRNFGGVPLAREAVPSVLPGWASCNIADQPSLQLLQRLLALSGPAPQDATAAAERAAAVAALRADHRRQRTAQAAADAARARWEAHRDRLIRAREREAYLGPAAAYSNDETTTAAAPAPVPVHDLVRVAIEAAMAAGEAAGVAVVTRATTAAIAAAKAAASAAADAAVAAVTAAATVNKLNSSNSNATGKQNKGSSDCELVMTPLASHKPSENPFAAVNAGAAMTNAAVILPLSVSIADAAAAASGLQKPQQALLQAAARTIQTATPLNSGDICATPCIVEAATPALLHTSSSAYNPAHSHLVPTPVAALSVTSLGAPATVPTGAMSPSMGSVVVAQNPALALALAGSTSSNSQNNASFPSGDVVGKQGLRVQVPAAATAAMTAPLYAPASLPGTTGHNSLSSSNNAINNNNNNNNSNNNNNNNNSNCQCRCRGNNTGCSFTEAANWDSGSESTTSTPLLASASYPDSAAATTAARTRTLASCPEHRRRLACTAHGAAAPAVAAVAEGRASRECRGGAATVIEACLRRPVLWPGFDYGYGLQDAMGDDDWHLWGILPSARGDGGGVALTERQAVAQADKVVALRAERALLRREADAVSRAAAERRQAHAAQQAQLQSRSQSTESAATSDGGVDCVFLAVERELRARVMAIQAELAAIRRQMHLQHCAAMLPPALSLAHRRRHRHRCRGEDLSSDTDDDCLNAWAGAHSNLHLDGMLSLRAWPRPGPLFAPAATSDLAALTVLHHVGLHLPLFPPRTMTSPYTLPTAALLLTQNPCWGRNVDYITLTAIINACGRYVARTRGTAHTRKALEAEIVADAPVLCGATILDTAHANGDNSEGKEGDHDIGSTNGQSDGVARVASQAASAESIAACAAVTAAARAAAAVQLGWLECPFTAAAATAAVACARGGRAWSVEEYVLRAFPRVIRPPWLTPQWAVACKRACVNVISVQHTVTGLGVMRSGAVIAATRACRQRVAVASHAGGLEALDAVVERNSDMEADMDAGYSSSVSVATDLRSAAAASAGEAAASAAAAAAHAKAEADAKAGIGEDDD